MNYAAVVVPRHSSAFFSSISLSSFSMSEVFPAACHPLGLISSSSALPVASLLPSLYLYLFGDLLFDLEPCFFLVAAVLPTLEVRAIDDSCILRRSPSSSSCTSLA